MVEPSPLPTGFLDLRRARGSLSSELAELVSIPPHDIDLAVIPRGRPQAQRYTDEGMNAQDPDTRHGPRGVRDVAGLNRQLSPWLFRPATRPPWSRNSGPLLSQIWIRHGDRPTWRRCLATLDPLLIVVPERFGSQVIKLEALDSLFRGFHLRHDISSVEVSNTTYARQLRSVRPEAKPQATWLGKKRGRTTVSSRWPPAKQRQARSPSPLPPPVGRHEPPKPFTGHAA